MAAENAEDVKIRKKRVLFRASKQLRTIVENMSVKLITDSDDDDTDTEPEGGDNKPTGGGTGQNTGGGGTGSGDSGGLGDDDGPLE